MVVQARTTLVHLRTVEHRNLDQFCRSTRWTADLIAAGTATNVQYGAHRFRNNVSQRHRTYRVIPYYTADFVRHALDRRRFDDFAALPK
jgi:hypothetical protein